MSLDLHSLIDQIADWLEFAGVAVVILGIVWASGQAAVSALRQAPDTYQTYRAMLGRAILLGLELLVGADIISTVTAPLTFESVALLGGIVLIRTFLSFSLETEIEGRWPWRRAEESDGPRRRA